MLIEPWCPGIGALSGYDGVYFAFFRTISEYRQVLASDSSWESDYWSPRLAGSVIARKN